MHISPEERYRHSGHSDWENLQFLCFLNNFTYTRIIDKPETKKTG
jgi:hypothetical protein